jgi:hypothetical protein
VEPNEGKGTQGKKPKPFGFLNRVGYVNTHSKDFFLNRYYYKVLAVTKLFLENIGRSVYFQYRVQDNKQKSIFNVLLMREAHISG